MERLKRAELGGQLPLQNSKPWLAVRCIGYRSHSRGCVKCLDRRTLPFAKGAKVGRAGCHTLCRRRCFVSGFEFVARYQRYTAEILNKQLCHRHLSKRCCLCPSFRKGESPTRVATPPGVGLRSSNRRSGSRCSERRPVPLWCTRRSTFEI